MSFGIDIQSLDAALADCADNADVMAILSDAPSSYANALTLVLGTVAMTPGSGNGDYLIEDDGAGGRKVTVTAKNGVTISSSGSATHISLLDSSNSRLKAFGAYPGGAVALVAGVDTANVPTWYVQFPQLVAA